MQLSRVGFPLWRLMVVVAGVACFAAAIVAFSDTRASGERVLFAWVTLYGAPLILIVARGVGLGRAAKIAGTIVLCGLPVVGFFGFFNLLVGLLAAIVILWIALLAVALFYNTLGKLVDKMYAPPPIRLGEPELPSLVYDRDLARPMKTGPKIMERLSDRVPASVSCELSLARTLAGETMDESHKGEPEATCYSRTEIS